MTSHELAKKLLELPDLMVTTDGYEGGYKEIDTIDNPKKLRLEVYSAWYYGPHEYIEEYNKDKTYFEKIIEAINIS